MKLPRVDSVTFSILGGVRGSFYLRDMERDMMSRIHHGRSVGQTLLTI